MLRPAPLVVPLLLLAAASCSRVEPEATPDPQKAPDPQKTSATRTSSADHDRTGTTGSAAATVDGPLVLAPPGIRFARPGPEPDVAKLVRDERAKADGDGRDLVVYVGARWCEPCQRFHEAAKRGDLDQDFPQLTILEFDLDEDRDRITAAGYQSKLIPLFVRPAEDGRASDRRFEGGIKGDGAVGNITPRLRRLVAK